MPAPDALRERLQTSLGGSYTIERELAGGGMSRVFVATETRLQRRVVVPVLAAGATREGLPYYTMPFVDGPSPRAVVAEGRTPVGQAVSILRPGARGRLAFALAAAGRFVAAFRSRGLPICPQRTPWPRTPRPQ